MHDNIDYITGRFMKRYLSGFIIGALVMAIFQFRARYNDIVKSDKAMLFSVEKAMYTGCLTGVRAVTGEYIASEETKVVCKAETLDYMEYLNNLYGESNEGHFIKSGD